MASVFLSLSFSLCTDLLSVYNDAGLVLHICNSDTARKTWILTYLMIANIRETSVRYFHNHENKEGAFPNRKVYFCYIFRPLIRLSSNKLPLK